MSIIAPAPSQPVRERTDALTRMVRLHDHVSADHLDAVAELGLSVGRRLRLGPAELRELELAARLHDVGKILVPGAILTKPGSLDDAEWRIMRRHSEWGAECLARVRGLTTLAPIVRSHHERWDGRGYPDGLRGAEIPLASRIIAACDAWDAMTSDRPYRAALAPGLARAELRECSGSQFDPRVVEALVEALQGAPAVAA